MPSGSRPTSIISQTDDDAPVAKAWWFHSSPLSLDDPVAPLPKAALEEGTWKPFSKRDCIALEQKWDSLPDRIKRKEEGFPDENGVVDELALQHGIGDGTGEKKQQDEEVDDVTQDDAKVIVGVEQLHHVDLVTLQLGPIYWHPLNSFLDSATVIRSIWFHADSFTPVEPALSRSLEEGYMALRAWSSTYADEFSSALSLGLEAEDKLRWKVREDNQGRELFFTSPTEAWIVPPVGMVSGLFTSKHVLKGIMEKGRGGIKVIRGYDVLPLNNNKEKEPEPIHYTDLIFVIHGIGQKLSERVESFTFTHAINRFRTHLNKERESDLIEKDIRPNCHPCILPVNWRSRLSFDFDRPPSAASRRPPLSRTSTATSSYVEDNIFSLKDLQPKSIPVVRDLIKDVMLDIPYYLSSHKEKILEAVVAEANRLWEVFCRCNSYFENEGRVHIIGHSLGSVIAMDVLSGQPTYVPKNDKVDKLHFAFNTTNLFCVGSPVGFFLMLERASLLPRANRRKTQYARKSEVEEAHGQFGCLAIDNLYNVYDLTDPVALHMNPTVDSSYARNNIAAVEIPRTLLPTPAGALSAAANVATSFLASTGSSPEKAPIEMETHDFRSEARAERIFNMLNDNGGLDFMLTPLGGWVDNQYVSMLSAHSGYWDRRDFARVIVVETGREDERTVEWLRAQKKIV